MAEKQTYKLIAPSGTKVEVTGATRRDTLLARGYTESGSAKPSGTTEKKS